MLSAVGCFFTSDSSVLTFTWTSAREIGSYSESQRGSSGAAAGFHSEQVYEEDEEA